MFSSQAVEISRGHYKFNRIGVTVIRSNLTIGLNIKSIPDVVASSGNNIHLSKFKLFKSLVLR